MITIEVDTKKLQNRLTNYSRNIPEASNLGVYHLAKYGAEMLKYYAALAGLEYWGGGKRELFRDTRARKVSRGNYVVVMPHYGRILDIGNYWISLKRGRLVTKWAKDRGLRTRVGGSIYVRPHPFIAKAITATINKAKGIVENEINKEIRRGILY